MDDDTFMSVKSEVIDEVANSLSSRSSRLASQASIEEEAYSENPSGSPASSHFEYIDFTTVSPMERVSRAIELLLLRWTREGLENKRSESFKTDGSSFELSWFPLDPQKDPLTSRHETGRKSFSRYFSLSGIGKLFGAGPWLILTMCSEGKCDFSSSLLLSALSAAVQSSDSKIEAGLLVAPVSESMMGIRLCDLEISNPLTLTSYRALKEKFPTPSLQYVRGVCEKFSSWAGLTSNQIKKIRTSIRLAFDNPIFRLYAVWEDLSSIVDCPEMSELDPSNASLWEVKLIQKMTKTSKFVKFRLKLSDLQKLRDRIESSSEGQSPLSDELESSIDSCFNSQDKSEDTIFTKACKGPLPNCPFGRFVRLIENGDISMSSISSAWRGFLRRLRNSAEGRKKLLTAQIISPNHMIGCLISQKIFALNEVLSNRPTPMTEDKIKEETIILGALSSSERAEFFTRSLKKEMINFRVTNPGASFEDFVCFFSPKDIKEGRLSSRFKSNHISPILWHIQWEESVNDLSPVSDQESEIEKILDYLENCDTFDIQILHGLLGVRLEQVSRTYEYVSFRYIQRKVDAMLEMLRNMRESAEVASSNSSKPGYVFYPSDAEFDLILTQFTQLENALNIIDNLLDKLPGMVELVDGLVSGNITRVNGIEERTVIEKLMGDRWKTKVTKKKMFFEFQSPALGHVPISDAPIGAVLQARMSAIVSSSALEAGLSVCTRIA